MIDEVLPQFVRWQVDILDGAIEHAGQRIGDAAVADCLAARQDVGTAGEVGACEHGRGDVTDISAVDPVARRVPHRAQNHPLRSHRRSQEQQILHERIGAEQSVADPGCAQVFTDSVVAAGESDGGVGRGGGVGDP